MISCVTFEYSKNPGFPVLFFPKLAALRKEFRWRPESVFSRKPDLPAAIFRAKNFSRDAYCMLPISSEAKLAAAVRFSTPSFG